MSDKKDFEILFENYKNISENLKDENITLDEAMSKYKESKVLYSKLKEILEESKLEIESFKEE